MHDQPVLRVVTKLVIPFIILFGLYVLMHGKYSSGGGFQAGVILAAAFILYGLVFGIPNATRVMPPHWLRLLAAGGIGLYAAVGIAGMLSGSHFLGYSIFFNNPRTGQFWSILLVEIGIGMTVMASMTLLFYTFATCPIWHEKPPASHDSHEGHT